METKITTEKNRAFAAEGLLDTKIAANTASITANSTILNNATSTNIFGTLVKRDDKTGGFEAGDVNFTNTNVIGNTTTGSLSSTTTNAGELTAGNTRLGETNINGTLSAGATTLTTATITGIATNTNLLNSKLVLADNNNTLTTLNILDEEHGGTGSRIKNFVDLTTDQTVDGEKSFTGKIKAGTLSVTTDASVDRDFKVLGKTSLGATTATSINNVNIISTAARSLTLTGNATLTGNSFGYKKTFNLIQYPCVFHTADKPFV